MKIIFKIAKFELNSLFFSPIAWFLAIIFFIQCAMFYTDSLEFWFGMQDLGGAYIGSLGVLTSRIIGGANGLVYNMMKYGYLYLPLLTMGLISREINGGTIKLLYSSPIKVSKIILGKYIAMLMYNLLLVLIVALMVVTGIFNLAHADIGLMLSTLLGMYLLLCTYAAIGLFMSCLTSYQVVAALCTLVVFALLDFLGGLGAGIDTVRDITFFFSIGRHMGNMLLGLITSMDILYFVLISTMFLVFSIFKLQSERESKSPVYVAIKYVSVVLLCSLIGYITSRPALSLYADATANKTMTLAPKSQEIIKRFGDAPLEITTYINLLDFDYWNGEPAQRLRDLSRYERYVRFKPDIKFQYVYYWDVPGSDPIFKQYPGKTLKQIAEHFAKNAHQDLEDFKTPEEIHKIIDLKPEGNGFVIQLKYKGKTSMLRLYKDAEKYPGERETDAALERLLDNNFPKIAFLKGQAERSIERRSLKDYSGLANTKLFRNTLINQGFDVMSLSLDNQDIPKDITALVIADPRDAFSPSVMSKINAFIAKGGNMIIAGDVGKQAVLNPLLAPLGVHMLDGILIQKSQRNLPSYIGAFLTKDAAGLEKKLLSPYEDSARVTMPEATALSWVPNSPYRIIPLVKTDARSTWNKKGSFSEDSISVSYSAKDGDVAGSFATILALTRQVNGKEQRIIIAGDADFASTAEFTKSGNTNFYLITSLFGWLAYEQFPINIIVPRDLDKRLNITDSGLKRLKIAYTMIIPGLLVIFAAVFLIRRKRK